MATQRITVAKVAGLSADLIADRFREWSLARRAAKPTEWSPEQWPHTVRAHADRLIGQLRSHAHSPPVVDYIEWVDMWAMGDLFQRWLARPDGPPPFIVYTNKVEIYAYPLPDGGCLAGHLANSGAQQFPEYDLFVQRLREAVTAWEKLVDRAILVVLRDVVGASVSDDEIKASLTVVPDWLS